MRGNWGLGLGGTAAILRNGREGRGGWHIGSIVNGLWPILLYIYGISADGIHSIHPTLLAKMRARRRASHFGQAEKQTAGTRQMVKVKIGGNKLCTKMNFLS